MKRLHIRLIMKYVFYQNILSMHQSACLRKLADHPGMEVTLVVAEETETGRDRQGWQQPDFGECCIILSPDEQKLQELTSLHDAVHVFTGMCAFPMVERAFKMSCAIPGMRRMVYSEPWRADGWRGKLRWLYYRWLAWKYSGKVEAFLLTGKLGVESYVRAGFPREKCHEWGYFTESPNMTPVPELPLEHSVPRLIFIGTWDVRKNILALVSALKSISLSFECLLLGDGYLRPQVNAEIGGDSRFHLIGNVPNTQIGGWLSACDVLVLPSLFDGWGAVVNEALMCGTRALVSDRCGAASLIASPKHGAVFPLRNMKDALESQILQGIQPEEDRCHVRQWAEANISGKVAAIRFLEICGEML